ncbi:SMP-30/gluconolactonase/LRE family protein [Conexibacter sp. CPCC 206217]|uniref:SMP-30/gluconolactonase/LRE family protein n=1 Tax=Conexibacter sp. CPCC 206217 TaxID=3064574 RepID=UPI0027167EAF|nr:SMP-30/gluconolactonase/LRE family protein [Conexibacter sp. CPCC 206217]MDO8212084.1 SMP-30/gluconolactonase/LRE family protein [Conexibacter sp. CPCC 206217]
MAQTAEVVVDGLVFPEGPVWCADGTVVCTDVALAVLYRIWPGEHRREVIARTDGGPNAAAPASDGGFVVTQNGGFDFTAAAGPGWTDQPVVHVPSGIQRVLPDGTVTTLAAGAFQNPNDLVTAADGTLYFTDPVTPPGGGPLGRVQAMGRDGTTRIVASGFEHCNGIALDPDGNLVVVEGEGLMRLDPDGTREWIVQRLGPGGADGFCFDAEGNVYAAGTTDHVVRVLDPRGTQIDELAIPDTPDATPGFTTNCCFGGPDGRSLYATDGRPGQLVVWEQMPVPGREVHAWPA